MKRGDRVYFQANGRWTNSLYRHNVGVIHAVRRSVLVVKTDSGVKWNLSEHMVRLVSDGMPVEEG